MINAQFMTTTINFDPYQNFHFIQYSYLYSFGLEDLIPLASCTPRRAMPELFNMGFIDTKKVSDINIT